MFWWVLAACGGGEPTDDGSASLTDTGPFSGTLALSFQISAELIEVLDPPETAAGTFYGSIYRNDEVNSFGPIEGATALGDLEIVLDLGSSGGPVGPVLVTDELPVDIVVILGFLDTDANHTDYSPDSGDPVTLPGQNKFQVEADAETPATVLFSLLNP